MLTQNSFSYIFLLCGGIVRQNDGLGFTFGLPTIHLLQDAIVRKNIRIKIVLILTRTPAGPNPITHKAGLLTYSLYRAFPTGWAVSGKECDRIYSLILRRLANICSQMPYGRQGMELTAAGTVSDSHRISFSPLATRVAWGTFCTTKVEMKNELANIFVEFFSEFFVQKNAV